MSSFPEAQVLPRKMSLLRSTSLVSLMTMFSRITGAARDIIIASVFGAGPGAEAFMVAFRIPNFARRLFAEGAFSQAFVPVLAEYQHTRGKEQVKIFLSYILGNLSLVLSLVSLAAILAAPWVVRVFAPGFLVGTERYDLAVTLLRVTTPYLAFVSLAAMVGAILNTYGRFGIPAFTPTLLNVCLILGALVFAPYFHPPIAALAWAVLLAGVIQFIFQLPFLSQQGLLVRPRVSWKDPGVRRVLKLMGPAVFGVSVGQVNLIVDTLFASFLPAGSVAWLFYSERLMNLPLGVFGVAIATVVLPTLSRNHSAGSNEEYQKNLDWGIRMTLLISMPAMMGLALCAGPIMATLFRHGIFSNNDVVMAATSLMTFSLGLPAYMLIKVLANGLYARKNIKTPVKIAIIAMISNIILNLILIKPLAHAGLALSTSIAAWINAGLLVLALRREKLFVPQSRWLRFLMQLLIANLGIVLWVWLTDPSMTAWLSMSWYGRIGVLATVIFPAMLVYVGLLRLCGLRWQQLRC